MGTSTDSGTVTTPSLPDIRVPSDLHPADGRFGSGPSKVRPAAIEALAAAAPSYLGTSHRRDGVRSVVGRIRHGMEALFSLPEGYEVVLGNGGATQFWDVSLYCLIDKRSQHLAFGEFSSKFAAQVAAAPHLDAPEIIESPPGTHPEAKAARGIDVYALTHNETSTGVCMDIVRPTGADDGSLVLVDATSAAGGMPVDPRQFDAYYFAPQKCFGSEGGLWLALCSPAAIERATRLRDRGRWAPATLDFLLAVENSRLDQTHNTPALVTLFLLADQVDWMLEQGGLEWTAARCRQSATAIYGWADGSSFAQPFVADAKDRSPVVATIDLDPAVNAEVMSAVLRANGIVDTESYRKLGRNQLRVALFPSIEPADVEALIACIDYVASALS